MLMLLLFVCTQAADPEALVARLGSDDPVAREKAVEELIARGPSIVPRILSLHRSTDSEETKLRAEKILCRFPFPAYVLTRPDEAVRSKIRDVLLYGIDVHRPVPGCWEEPENRPKIDGARLHILRQGGGGHGQTLMLDDVTPHKDGGLGVRRIAYEGPTAYRPDVKEERTRVEEMVLDPEQTRALTSLLEAAVALRPLCSREEDQRGWFTSSNFSLRFRIHSGEKSIWQGNYTGYRSSEGEKLYAHGLILDHLLDLVLAQRTWTPSAATAEDVRRLLRWTEENFDREAWWVRERYLRMAFGIGDESFLPLLRRIAKELAAKEDPSEKRQRTYAREALRRISGSED